MKWADVLRTEEKVLDTKGRRSLSRLDSRQHRIRSTTRSIRPRSRHRGWVAPSTTRRPTIIAPIAIHRHAAKPPHGFSWARVCSVPSATTIRSIAGRKTIITSGRRCFRKSITNSARTNDKTIWTRMSLRAIKPCWCPRQTKFATSTNRVATAEVPGRRRT